MNLRILSLPTTVGKAMIHWFYQLQVRNKSISKSWYKVKEITNFKHSGKADDRATLDLMRVVGCSISISIGRHSLVQCHLNTIMVHLDSISSIMAHLDSIMCHLDSIICHLDAIMVLLALRSINDRISYHLLQMFTIRMRM